MAQREILLLVPGKVLLRKCIKGLGTKINQEINRNLCEVNRGPPSFWIILAKIGGKIVAGRVVVKPLVFSPSMHVRVRTKFVRPAVRGNVCIGKLWNQIYD